ncbi:hypothetical protein IJS77_02595 [bacterium]|nr:hypothetical protein [bacterium]
MAFSIITKYGEKTVQNREVVNISSKAGSDIVMNLGFDYLITIQYDKTLNRCTILNPFNNPNFLFKGAPMGAKLDVTNVCKIMVANSDEFIGIKIIPQEAVQNKPVPQQPVKQPETVSAIAEQGFTKDDIQNLYGNSENAETKIKIDKNQQDIEKERVAIIKQVAYKINDLRNKISMGTKSNAIIHVGLFFASVVCAFGVANYLTGLPLKDAQSIIQMPTNLKLVILYSVVIFGLGLMLKQGVFLCFQNKINQSPSPTAKIAEKFMTYIPIIFFVAIYFINVLYYIAPGGFPFFAILISLFFVTICATLAAGCGYFKSYNIENSMELEKYEYREDFEKVVKDYQKWIEKYINSLSVQKLKGIKDKIFSEQIMIFFETLAGIITAPFLAYGVSNTLASCFPEAAGWVRISGLRFSPIFLVLAAIMIVLGFFMFANAFFNVRKIQGSNVLKQDGFSNYKDHGVEIFGLAGVRKLNSDKIRCLIIGIAIIFIEFTMNVSYFMQTKGDNLSEMLLSIVAALVVTAILIAETYLLSATKYEKWTLEEIIAKVDKEF